MKIFFVLLAASFLLPGITHASVYSQRVRQSQEQSLQAKQRNEIAEETKASLGALGDRAESCDINLRNGLACHVEIVGNYFDWPLRMVADCYDAKNAEHMYNVKGY